MNRLTKAALVAGGTAVAGLIGWSVYANQTADTERVPYTRIGQLNGVELRRYPQTMLVETAAPNQRTAFRRLFRYISGANTADRSIPMTTPVETQPRTKILMTTPVRSVLTTNDAAKRRMAFYLPAEYDPDTAPEPTAANVELVTEPEKTVAVSPFSWYATDGRVKRHSQQLLDTLAGEDIEPVGALSLLQYNSPWTPPFLRRNEVAVEVTLDDDS